VGGLAQLDQVGELDLVGDLDPALRGGQVFGEEGAGLAPLQGRRPGRLGKPEHQRVQAQDREHPLPGKEGVTAEEFADPNGRQAGQGVPDQGGA
jgi:hypothetical protein